MSEQDKTDLGDMGFDLYMRLFPEGRETPNVARHVSRTTAIDRALSAAYAAGRMAGLREAGKSCNWTYDDIHDYYETACGESYCLTTGTLDENRHRYCVYCGGQIEQAVQVEGEG